MNQRNINNSCAINSLKAPSPLVLTEGDTNTHYINIIFDNHIQLDGWKLFVLYQVPPTYNNNVIIESYDNVANPFKIKIPNAALKRSGDLFVEFSLRKNNEIITVNQKLHLKIETTIHNNKSNNIILGETINSSITSKIEQIEILLKQANDKIIEYNNNAILKVDEYNKNAISKFNEYENNAALKISEYNFNTTSKLKEYNDNVVLKVDEYNKNSETKLNSFNDIYLSKTNSFNENSAVKTKTFDDNVLLKINEFNLLSTQSKEELTAQKNTHISDIQKESDKQIKSIQTTSSAQINNINSLVTNSKQEINTLTSTNLTNITNTSATELSKITSNTTESISNINKQEQSSLNNIKTSENQSKTNILAVEQTINSNLQLKEQNALSSIQKESNQQILTLKTSTDQYVELKNQEIKGATFTPNVTPDGILSWTNDKNLVNPENINIKGPKGDPGQFILQIENGDLILYTNDNQTQPLFCLDNNGNLIMEIGG